MSSSEQVLSIDTSTENAGVAVLNGDRVVELRWTSGREQTVSVLDQIDRCLTLAGIRASDLTGIAVATGPGMFNGLRVGISLAKGFALSLGVPIFGMSTLELTASPWRDFGRVFGLDIIPVVAAGRGRVVYAHYTDGHGGDSTPVNVSGDEFIAMLQAGNGNTIVAGEIPDDRIDEVRHHCRLLCAGAEYPRNPVVLAHRAREAFRAGLEDDLATLEPTYVHGRSAVTHT